MFAIQKTKKKHKDMEYKRTITEITVEDKRRYKKIHYKGKNEKQIMTLIAWAWENGFDYEVKTKHSLNKKNETKRKACKGTE